MALERSSYKIHSGEGEQDEPRCKWNQKECLKKLLIDKPQILYTILLR